MLKALDRQTLLAGRNQWEVMTASMTPRDGPSIDPNATPPCPLVPDPPHRGIVLDVLT